MLARFLVRRGPPTVSVDDGSAELGTACCRLVRRHQFQMSHVVASVHRTRLTEPMRRPQREHENRDIWEKLQCRVTTVRHETRFKWRVPLLVAVVFLLAVAIASVVLFLNWRSDGLTETRQLCGQRCTSEDLDRLKRFLDLDERPTCCMGVTSALSGIAETSVLPQCASIRDARAATSRGAAPDPRLSPPRLAFHSARHSACHVAADCSSGNSYARRVPSVSSTRMQVRRSFIG